MKAAEFLKVVGDAQTMATSLDSTGKLREAITAIALEAARARESEAAKVLQVDALLEATEHSAEVLEQAAARTREIIRANGRR